MNHSREATNQIVEYLNREGIEIADTWVAPDGQTYPSFIKVNIESIIEDVFESVLEDAWRYSEVSS